MTIITESTPLKEVSTAGDSYSKPDEMNIGKVNTFQRQFLIVAGSLLALFLLIAVTGKSYGQHVESSAYETDTGAGTGTGALVDYQVYTANSALVLDIFGMSANTEFKPPNCCTLKCPTCKCADYCPCCVSYCNGRYCSDTGCTVGCIG